jgi:hypothetical protein
MIDASGTGIAYCACLGGSGDEFATRVALDPAGHVYIAGAANSSNFPRRAAFQPPIAGSWDAFVGKFGVSPAEVVDSLMSEVAALGLRPAARWVLTNTLERVQAAIERGDSRMAELMLHVFINEVRALMLGRRLDPATGTALIAEARALMARL